MAHTGVDLFDPAMTRAPWLSTRRWTRIGSGAGWGGGPAGLASDAEPRMVVHTGDHLRLATVGEPDPADNVHLPQFHRDLALPALVVLPAATPRGGHDQAVADKHPMHRDPGRDRAGTAVTAQLELDPSGTPPRMRPTHFTDRGFHLRRGLARGGMRPAGPVGQTVQALFGIPADPPVNRLTGDAEPFGDLGHRHAGLGFQHGPIPLLCHGQLHQHSAECHARPETDLSRRS